MMHILAYSLNVDYDTRLYKICRYSIYLEMLFWLLVMRFGGDPI